MVLADTPGWGWVIVAFVGLLVIVFVAIFVVVLLQIAARRSIERVVRGPPGAPSRPETKEDAGAQTPTPRVGIDPPPELAVETLEIDALPEGGPAYRARHAAQLERGPAIRKVYRRAVIILAVPIAAALVANAALARDVHEIPLWLPILFAVSLTMLYFAGAASSPGASIGPLIMPLLGSVWVALAAGALWTSFAEQQRGRWIALIVIGATVTVAFLWLRRGRRRLEKQYPIPAPFNLLFLRVFGQADVYSLARQWQPFGPFLMLGGPDTGGKSTRDMHYAFTGRAHQVVVENAAELDEALAELAGGLDSHLRYPARALQCTDATWAVALERLLPAAHVVAMDLSGFSSARGGSVYEIGRLVDEVPTEQVTLFVFDTTDIAALERTVRAAWNEMSADSPNRQSQPRRLRIVSSRGFVTRARANPKLANENALQAFAENLYDRVRSLLCDAAAEGLARSDPPYAQRTGVIDWGRTGIPQIVRRAGVWILGLGFCAVAVSALSGGSVTRVIAAASVGLTWLLAIDRASVGRSETLVGQGRWRRRSTAG